MSSPNTPKRTPPPIPPFHSSLRILCQASHISAFIGKSGSSIKHLQLQTGFKIRVTDSLKPGSDHRIILIVGPTAPSKKVKLRKRPHDDVDSEYDVSVVQETAMRVFEKVLEVSEGETTSFRVLIDDGEVGSVIGKGGKIVEKLRRESGAIIRVLSGDHLPPYVSHPDAIVEIDGDLLAVKKGILGVCGRLQLCPQGDYSSKKENKPVESTSPTTTLYHHVDPPLPKAPLSMVGRPLSFEIQQTSPSKATMSSSANAVVRPMSFEGDYPAHTKLKSDQREVVFKILCSNDIAGGLIGRGGSIVRALQEESGAHISVGAPITNCDERSVTVTSKENVDSRYSSAQLAVILVFSRFAEAAIEKGLDTGSNKGPSFARLLVPSNQIGCLLGKGGSIVSEMRKATGANIRILKGKQVPKCASGDDQVVEITGQFVKIQDALHQVTSRLRSNLYPSNATSISGRFRDSTVGINRSFATSQATDRLSTMRQGVESLNSSHRSYHSPLARSQSSKANEVNSRTFENLGRGSVPANGGSEHSRPAIVTNTTLEILVPEDAISSIYGENEKNLMRIRQISGAKVTVHESQPGTRDSTVVISGTPEETQAAQSLLHAFLLSGSS